MAKNNRPRATLIVRFSALGDVAIAIPVIYSVCRNHPEQHFVMVTRNWQATLFVGAPANLTVKGVDLRGKHRGLRGMCRLARELRKEYDITAFADLHSVLRTWALGAALRLHGVKTVCIDKGRADKHRLVKGKIRCQLTPTYQRYEAVFETLGFDTANRFERLDVKASPVVPAKTDGEFRVAVAPFSAHEGKVYPLDKMRLVVEQLTATPGVSVVLFGGGAKEKAVLREWAANVPHTMSLAEIKHEFADEFAMLDSCDVMLSMDSANMHLASLMRVPVVSVWGATHPHCGFMGWQQPEELAVQLDLPCRPCAVYGERQCRFGDYRCMNNITPEQIVNKVLALKK